MKVKHIALMYLALIIILSIAGNIFSFPETFLSKKTSFLNVIFAKYAFAWSFIPLLPFHIIQKRLKLWILASLYWFILTQSTIFGPSIFHRIYSIFGSCLNKSLSYNECMLSSTWNGFDISGHTFLLIHSSLILYYQFKINRNFYVGLFCLLLVAIWSFVLAVTCLYYHHLGEKISGAVVALLFWVIQDAGE